ncbi:hypothetical protein BDP27DRAFT_1368400 [Rhodocollybia butyracea]|uniref:Uncharacterized protein n=1 Tax=Rhodocollybia butyracea TaxID=206335 RepID=A0A9P5PJ21_9AGAR|nr:hypothetical protein BDP27DRAFT_1368400 [Rhodocollybia butyracea]
MACNKQLWIPLLRWGSLHWQKATLKLDTSLDAEGLKAWLKEHLPLPMEYCQERLLLQESFSPGEESEDQEIDGDSNDDAKNADSEGNSSNHKEHVTPFHLNKMLSTWKWTLMTDLLEALALPILNFLLLRKVLLERKESSVRRFPVMSLLANVLVQLKLSMMKRLLQRLPWWIPPYLFSRIWPPPPTD